MRYSNGSLKEGCTTSCIYREAWPNHKSVETESAFYSWVDLKVELTRDIFLDIEGYIYLDL